MFDEKLENWQLFNICISSPINFSFSAVFLDLNLSVLLYFMLGLIFNQYKYIWEDGITFLFTFK